MTLFPDSRRKQFIFELAYKEQLLSSVVLKMIKKCNTECSCSQAQPYGHVAVLARHADIPRFLIVQGCAFSVSGR